MTNKIKARIQIVIFHGVFFLMCRQSTIFVSNTHAHMKKIILSILMIHFAMSAFSQNMITTSAIQQPQFREYRITFPDGKSILYETHGDNTRSLKHVMENINSHMSSLRYGEYYINVVSSVKTRDNEKSATRLARKRALTLKSYLIKKVGAKEEHFRTSLKVNQDPYLIEGISIALASAVPVKDNTAIIHSAK